MRSRALRFFQAVAQAAQAPDDRGVAELRAQSRDLHFHGVRADILLRRRHGLLHALLRYDLAGAPYQAFEDQPLARGELDFGLIDAEPAPVEIDAHAIELDAAVERAAGAAHQRAAARGKLGRLERLGEEIVSADVERLHFLGQSAARGQY